MRQRRTALAALALGFPLLVAGWSGARGARYGDGPPPGFTGAFGEGTCVTCHVDAAVEKDAPGISLAGLPSAWEPGGTYRVTVRATHRGMGAAGFQLASRTGAGVQAGAWRSVDARTRVTHDSGRRVVYAAHTVAGSALTARDTAAWVLEWTAPAVPHDSIIVGVAVNAANGDDSNFGDHVMTRSFVVRRPRPARP